MCGWSICELVDWSSGHLGKWEVPTSTYHVARLPGSPIAQSPNRRLDQLAPRRIDQPTPCVSAGNRNRLEGKSQIDRPCTAHRRRSGGTAEPLAGWGNALDLHRVGEVRVSASITMSGLCRRGEHAVGVPQAGMPTSPPSRSGPARPAEPQKPKLLDRLREVLWARNYISHVVNDNLAAPAPAQWSGDWPAAVGRHAPRRPTAPAAATPPCGRGKPRTRAGCG